MAKTAPAPTTRTIPAPPLRRVARALLLIGFAFAVMADPVSSVAYTIEASLRALHGHLHLLLATQLILLVSAGVLLAAAGREQELVLFYAVAVFVSFLAGLTAMTRFSLRDRRPLLAAVNALGAVSVAFTLAFNLGRGFPVLSLVATALIAAGLYLLWRRAGRPTGVQEIERLAESGE
jgi:hypothetical protein